MIRDALGIFGTAQAITNAAGSTSYIDLKAVRAVGTGEDLYVTTIVTTAMTDTGSNSTLSVDFQLSASTSFTTPTNVPLFVIPELTAVNTVYKSKIGIANPAPLQYAQIYYTPNNGDLSAGAFTSFLTCNVDSRVNYAKGYTVSSSGQFA